MAADARQVAAAYENNKKIEESTKCCTKEDTMVHKKIIPE